MNHILGVRKMVALALLALCVGCAHNFGLRDRIAIAYDANEAYIKLASSLLERGRITKDQAAQVSKNTKRITASLDFVSGLGACPAEPCTPADQLMAAESILLDLERELKAKEK